MGSSQPARLVLSAAVTVSVVLAVATLVFLVATRNFSASTSGAGVAGSTLQGWRIDPGIQEFGHVIRGFDLAAQAGTNPAFLVLGAAFNSALLLLVSTASALVLGVPLGFWLAIHAPRRIAQFVKSASSIGIAFPAFFVAFLLQVLAVELAGRLGRTVLPVYGFGVDAHLVIPVVALSLLPFAYVARLMALAATDLAARDFVRTARAKGLSEILVVYRHLAPNMLGAIGEAGLGAFRFALGGLVIVEYLLVWPGLGVLALRAANVQDLSLFLLTVSLLAAVLCLTDLGLDLVTDRRGIVAG